MNISNINFILVDSIGGGKLTLYCIPGGGGGRIFPCLGGYVYSQKDHLAVLQLIYTLNH